MKVTILEREPGVFRLRIETADGATGKRVFSYETVKGSADDAARRRHEIMSKAEEGSFALPAKLTVAAYLDKWLETREALGIVSKLITDQRRAIIGKWIVPAFGATRLQRLAGHQIQDLYTDMLKAGRSGATVHAMHSNILRPALREARKQKLITSNPIDEVTAPKKGKPAPAAFSEAELERVLRALEGEEIEPIVLTALGTGLRRGEACGLRWKDIDLAGRMIHVRGQIIEHADKTIEWKAPKTDHSVRKVSIPGPIVELLSKWRATVVGRYGLQFAQGADYVFGGMTPDALTHAFKRICVKAGVEGHGAFHRLRHSHITLLLKNVGREGAKAVSQRVGHSNVAFTLSVYQTVFEDEDKGLADLAAGLFDRKRGAK